ncbi:MAG: tetratricopeptide repeat protein [Pseudomonadota bacterium]|nr:tetratricopeptide repeat protein [Pseudomonadota bacterium]
MSLINQVLKDLEKRDRHERDLILPKAVSSRASLRTVQWPWMIVGFAALLSAGFAIGFFGFHHNRPIILPVSKPVPVEKTAIVVDAKKPVIATNAAKPTSGISVFNQHSPSPGRSFRSVQTADAKPGRVAILAKRKFRSPTILVTLKHTASKPVHATVKLVKPVETNTSGAFPFLRPANNHEQSQTQYQQGIKMLESGRIADALTAFRQAITLDPENAPARQALAQLYIEQHQFMAAETVLKAGLANQPGLLAFSFPLARLLVEQGKDAKALEILEKSQDQGIKNANYLALRADIFTRLGRSSEAISDYQQALLLKPQEVSWIVGLGIAFEANHDPEEARKVYIEAISARHLPSVLENFVQRRLSALSGG